MSPLTPAVSAAPHSGIGVGLLVVRCSKGYVGGKVGLDAALQQDGWRSDRSGRRLVTPMAGKETDMTPRTMRARWMPAMVLLAGGLAACDRHAPQRVAMVDDGTPQSLDQAIARVDEAGMRLTDGRRQDAAEMQASMQDAAITARVNAALMSDRQLSGLHIEVQTQGGTVTLRGSAPDALAIARATELASAVEGVTSVVNEIKVTTT